MPLSYGRRTTGIPCLPVADLDKALWYYQRFFGFTRVTPEEPITDTAFVRGHGVILQLQQTPAHADPCADRPNAVILVDRPQRLLRELDDLGAHLVSAADLGPGWRDFFGVRDCYGNVLGIGPTTGLGTVRRWASGPAEEVLLRLHERRMAREEARHLAEFRQFYEDLENKQGIYYLMFNQRLLHWVVKTAGYVPDDVNLVLLGSDLPAEEASWIRQHLDRPFHHVQLRIDEGSAWEFLFAVNQHNFGWLGLGAFVLNRRLLGRLAAIDPGTSLNCIWSWDSGLGFPVANTYLLFINVTAIDTVRRHGIDPNPNVFAYERFNRQLETRRCYSRRPSRAQLDRLRTLLPPDASGLPAIPGGMATFEPTVLYQILARTCGLEIKQVRELSAFDHVRGGEVQDQSSDEVFHLGGLGIADVLEEFSGYFHDDDVRLRYAIAEYLALSKVAEVLPPPYQERLDKVTEMLVAQGLPTEAVEETAHRHLTQMHELSPAAAKAVTGTPAMSWR